VLWSDAKVVGEETLRTVGKILTDIADNDTRPRDIIAKHVGESAQNLVQKQRGRGRKRATPRGIPSKKKKKVKLTNETSSQKMYHSLSDHVSERSVSKFRVLHIC
jgi:hypothetical protein